jgi:hypothetical protein
MDQPVKANTGTNAKATATVSGLDFVGLLAKCDDLAGDMSRVNADLDRLNGRLDGDPDDEAVDEARGLDLDALGEKIAELMGELESVTERIEDMKWKLENQDEDEDDE